MASLEAQIRKPQNVEAMIFGPLTIQELLTHEDGPGVSITIIKLKGNNHRVRNTQCDANYFVIEGTGVFNLEINNKQQSFDVTKGDLVVIPKGTWYQDKGDMIMLSVCTPAFDQSQVERD